MTPEERAWERTRAAILRRLNDPSEENAEAASRRVDELVEAMQRPKERRPKAA